MKNSSFLKASSKVLFPVFVTVAVGCAHPSHDPLPQAVVAPAIRTFELPQEVRIKNLRQLTTAGTNAEAYWSFDGKNLSFQHRGPESNPNPACDQIYSIAADGSGRAEVSNGQGRTTCSYYVPDGSRILYSSTFGEGAACPPNPDHSKGYVWPVYPSFQIYSAAAVPNKDGSRDVKPAEPNAPHAYNAETTLCKDGSVVFTSDRDGDLDLYTAKLSPEGTLVQIKRVTHGMGYDGGAFFSPDCTKLVWRASRPQEGKELNDYKALLKQHLVKPAEMEIWVSNADGSDAHQVTFFGPGVASFAPYFTPDQKSIIFSSNVRKPASRFFDLYLIGTQGTGLERVTYSDTFESFAMFSPDGHSIAFSSNRNNVEKRDTNLFIGDWVEGQRGPLTPVAADGFMETVNFLANADQQGRGVGTAGLGRAEDFVEKRFKKLGLKPWEGESYRQKVVVRGKEASNLIGVRGENCENKSGVLVGAHLDHLGVREVDGVSSTFLGADDNASGIAGLLLMAEKSANLSLKNSCLYFAAFTGEESGVVGSSLFAKVFLQEKKRKLSAMLNFDMIGRMTDNQLLIFGAESSKKWKPWVKETCSTHRLNCKAGGDGFGPSDHFAFYQQGIPVLHFFTGSHLDHHAPTDTPDKVNATGGVQTVAVAFDVLQKVLEQPKPLDFVKPTKASLAAQTPTGGRALKASLGTIPDYAQLAEGETATPGVKLSGARPGSAADKAGIKGGDILLALRREVGAETQREWKSTPSLEAFSRLLGELEAGDRVQMRVLRGSQNLVLSAVAGPARGH